jgi:hypothetical protein
MIRIEPEERYCERPTKDGSPCRQRIYGKWEQACKTHATEFDDELAATLESVDVAGYTRGYRKGYNDGRTSWQREAQRRQDQGLVST